MSENGQGVAVEHRKTKPEIREMVTKPSDERCFSRRREDKEGKHQRVIKEDNY